MIARLMTTAALVGAVAMAPADRAEADAGDFIGGLAVGVIGTLAVQEANRNRTPQTTTVRRAAPAGIPATERGMQTQTALNYFGYNAGRVDGQIGNGTRAAIERYQATMGYPINGRDFSDYQFETLMAAYYWGQNGGQQQTGLAGQPLLMAYRNQVMGSQQAAAPGFAPAPVGPLAAAPAPAEGGAPSIFAASPAPSLSPAPGLAPAPQPTLAAQGTAAPPALGAVPLLQAPAAAPETVALAPQAPATGLPNFMATGAAKSLASHCNTVSLLTGTNGGFTSAANVTDADFALSEQFCLARTYAVETGQDLAANVQGVSSAQIEAQCGAFGPALAAQVSGLPVKAPEAVLQEVAGFVLNSGLAPADLAGTARICLGVGYRTDAMDVALGSALILAALGERAYGELMGHHLSQGFGTAKSAERAQPWYEMGLEAAEAGAVFAPGQPERVDVIRAAVTGAAPVADPVVVPASGGAQPLVTFTVKQ